MNDQRDGKNIEQEAEKDVEKDDDSIPSEEAIHANDRPILSRLTTSKSASSWKDPGPPPDKGLTAWTQACMGHLMVFNTWGVIASYGVFETYYISALGLPSSDIAWIGSCQIFLLFFIGTFSGRALDAGYFHIVYRTGVFFQLLGLFMTSLSTKYWQLFLAQGLCSGIGNGLVFTPTMGLVSTYFSTHKSLVMCFAASGSTTGGVILPLIVRQLLPKVGFPWTVRVLGFVILVTGVVSALVLRTRIPPRKAGPIVEWSTFRELPYTLVCIGMFLNMWALFFGFYYIGAFSRDLIGFSYQDSINLLMIMNGVGFFGRVIPGYLSDKFGAINLITPWALISGILFFAWNGIHSTVSVYIFASLYGFFTGGVQACFPATMSSMTTDLSKAGVRLGMSFSFISLGTLTGPPLGGALLQAGNGSYLYAQIWGGCCLTLGGLFIAAARIAKTGWKVKVKV